MRFYFFLAFVSRVCVKREEFCTQNVCSVAKEKKEKKKEQIVKMTQCELILLQYI